MTVLVVDAMPIVYSSFAKVGHLCTKSGIPTGMSYGFLRSVRSWANSFDVRRVVICWDTKEPVLKAEGLKEYKSNRVMTEDKQKMFDQIPALKEMLSLTGFTQLEAPGHEADDLCATVAKYYWEYQQEDSIIASVDRDLWASVSEHVYVYHTVKDKKVIKPEDVQKHFSVPPMMVPLHKAVFGDTSDNIAAVIDSSNAFNTQILGILNSSDTVEQALHRLWDAGLAADTMEQIGARLRTTSLIDVPKDEWVITIGKQDKEGLIALFEKLEFASMMKFVDQLVGGNFEIAAA